MYMCACMCGSKVCVSCLPQTISTFFEVVFGVSVCACHMNTSVHTPQSTHGGQRTASQELVLCFHFILRQGLSVSVAILVLQGGWSSDIWIILSVLPIL